MGAESFIATCRELTALDFSSGVADRALTLTEVVLPDRYAMPTHAGLRHPSPHMHTDGRNRRGQWHEAVQHLTDLAYLTPGQFGEWHAWRESKTPQPPPLLLGAVLSAVGKFVAEDDYPPFRAVGGFPSTSRSDQLDWTEQMLSVLVLRAGAYTSFDAEMSPRADYRIGEHSAYGRSLAYRVRVLFHDYLDRKSTARKTYFDDDLVPYLHSLDNSLGGELSAVLPQKEDRLIHLTVQALLLDAQLIFDKFRETHRFLPQSPRPYFLVYDLDDPAGIPLLDDRDAKRLERLSKRAGRRLEREELHQDTGTNRLGVRLLQIGLWRAGVYPGTLDGIFGKLSHDALTALVQQEREAGGGLTARQLDRVCLPAGAEEEQLWIVDLRLAGILLDAYVPPPEAEARREEDLIWERIRREGLDERLDDQLDRRRDELRLPYGDLRKHPHRRVYYGIRGLIRGAFRAIGRVIGWIAGAVRAVLGAVFDFVKAVVKRIQEGIGMFLEGFRYLAHYLLGRPFVTLGEAVDGKHPVLLTRFAVDMDAVTFLDESSSGQDRRTHVAYLKRMGESVDFFLDSVVGIVRLVGSLSAPVGWVQLGVLIARWVRDQLTDVLFRGRAIV
ncbi:hypothetical protein [Lewinella sp. JB7]|uniref:hypothetical protein n=1 Tax=Lewinella sp. JB7 TaxID=2962887 RepID=UPI0020C9DA62|nr:hypothetical protein [Lewinella sp. JB7]MCP9237764.1 hypothetical protein [Lewinella sp. JB7]